MAQGNIRISVCNLPDDLSPLKMGSYLKQEAAQIQSGLSGNDICILRVLIPTPLLLKTSGKQRDKLFQKIVDSNANIYRVETVQVDSQLTPLQMAEEAERAKHDIHEMVNQISLIGKKAANDGGV